MLFESRGKEKFCFSLYRFSSGFFGEIPHGCLELDLMIIFYDSLILLYAMISSSALLKNGYLFVEEEQRRTYHCVDAIPAGTACHLPAVLMCL